MIFLSRHTYFRLKGNIIKEPEGVTIKFYKPFRKIFICDCHTLSYIYKLQTFMYLKHNFIILRYIQNISSLIVDCKIILMSKGSHLFRRLTFLNHLNLKIFFMNRTLVLFTTKEVSTNFVYRSLNFVNDRFVYKVSSVHKIQHTSEVHFTKDTYIFRHKLYFIPLHPGCKFNIPNPFFFTKKPF